MVPGQQCMELAKEGHLTSQRRPSPAWHLACALCSEGKKEYCFMMGWIICVTHSFRSIGGKPRERVREPADALLVRWRIAPKQDCQ